MTDPPLEVDATSLEMIELGGLLPPLLINIIYLSLTSSHVATPPSGTTHPKNEQRETHNNTHNKMITRVNTQNEQICPATSPRRGPIIVKFGGAPITHNNV